MIQQINKMKFSTIEIRFQVLLSLLSLTPTFLHQMDTMSSYLNIIFHGNFLSPYLLYSHFWQMKEYMKEYMCVFTYIREKDTQSIVYMCICMCLRVKVYIQKNRKYAIKEIWGISLFIRALFITVKLWEKHELPKKIKWRSKGGKVCMYITKYSSINNQIFLFIQIWWWLRL